MILAIAACLMVDSLRLESEWTAPGQLPFSRVHAIVKTHSEYYIGGLRGLARGRPGDWKTLDERPVKQMIHDGESVWVLFGDGSLDKIEYKRDRLVFDVMNGAVRRPWVSSLGLGGKAVLMGGQGGWFVRADSLIETYRKELEGQVITTITQHQGALWLGTQKKGLFSIKNGSLTRYGFAAGLPDSWVTCAASTGSALYLGVADGGVHFFSKGRIAPFDTPSTKTRLLTIFEGTPVVGGMEGCFMPLYLYDWQQFTREETTCLTVVEGKLYIGTPRGLQIWRKG